MRIVEKSFDLFFWFIYNNKAICMALKVKIISEVE